MTGPGAAVIAAEPPLPRRVPLIHLPYRYSRCRSPPDRLGGDVEMATCLDAAVG